MQTHKVHWKVSLSNGETCTEYVGRFDEIEGDLSPWQKLLVYLEENRLQITSLVLVTSDNRTFNLPSAGKNPKSKRFDVAGKPVGYRCERFYGTDRDGDGNAINNAEWYTLAVAVYNDYELQLWVDENDTRNCWTLILPK